MGAGETKTTLSDKIQNHITLNDRYKEKLLSDKLSQKKFQQFLSSVIKRCYFLKYSWVRHFTSYIKKDPAQLYSLYCKSHKESITKFTMKKKLFSIPQLQQKFREDYFVKYQTFLHGQVQQEVVQEALDQAKIYIMITDWFEQILVQDNGQERKSYQSQQISIDSELQLIYSINKQLLSITPKTTQIQEKIKNYYNCFWSKNKENMNVPLSQKVNKYLKQLTRKTTLKDIQLALSIIRDSISQQQEKHKTYYFGEIIKVVGAKQFYVIIKTLHQLGRINISFIWEFLREIIEKDRSISTDSN